MPIETKIDAGPDAYMQLIEAGAEHHRARRFADAERLYLSAMKLNSTRSDAQRLLGVLYIETDSFDRAKALLRQVLSRNPRDTKLLHELALGFEKLNLFGETREAASRAIALDPAFLDARLTLGAILTKHGDTAEALHTYKRSHELHPQDARPLAETTRLLVFEGRFAEAQEAAETALKLDPGNVNALSFLARTRKFAPGDPLFDRIKAALTRETLAPYERRQLHQSLGKLYDDGKDYDTAFFHYTTGNAIRDRDYDHAAQKKRWDDLKAVYNKAFFAAHAADGNPSTRPIFITGMPRSGTSLVEQVLSTHPRIFGGGELALIPALAAESRDYCPPGKPYPFCLSAIMPEGVRSLARKYLDGLNAHDRTSDFVTDKYPHNFENIGLIALLFPNARIVYCKRNPIDVGLSIFLNLMTSPYPWSTRLEDIADHYRDHEDLMRHWFDVLPGRIVTVEYERFTSNFETEARTLVASLGLEWDDACLSFADNERSVRTPSAWQVRQPVTTASVGKWQSYRKHLGPLLKLAGEA